LSLRSVNVTRPSEPEPLRAHNAPEQPDSLQARINAALPQTQCTRCGFPDCAGYASAIATHGAPINQCPPGGAEGIERLAAITGRPVTALNPVHGLEGPRAVAVIDETWCIGCTLCIDACPTDAIFGSNKMMHTVIEPYCTGCELCIPVCPVDCISLENVTGDQTGWAAWSATQAALARTRYEFHSYRRISDKGCRPEILEKPAETGSAAGATDETPAASPAPALSSAVLSDAAADRRAVIDAALARSRALRQTK
jgi:Na+-translocating ferredoxin:NAD+ oxidoreductase subunit B